MRLDHLLINPMRYAGALCFGRRPSPAKGDSLAAMSRMLGRRSGYLTAFVNKGVPRALRERHHAFLTNYLDVTIGIRDLLVHDS